MPVSEDRKATEHLANERTFLAWIRTSIAVITLGFVMAKFGRVAAGNCNAARPANADTKHRHFAANGRCDDGSGRRACGAGSVALPPR